MNPDRVSIMKNEKELLNAWVQKESESLQNLMVSIINDKIISCGITTATKETVSLEFKSNSNTRIPYVLERINTKAASEKNEDYPTLVKIIGYIYFRKHNGVFLHVGPPAYCAVEVTNLPYIHMDRNACTPWRFLVAYMNSFRHVQLSDFIRRLRHIFPRVDNDYDFSMEGAKEIVKAKTCCDQCKSTMNTKRLHCSHCRVAVYCSNECQVIL